jgi:LAO/AO transport system kinase
LQGAFPQGTLSYIIIILKMKNKGENRNAWTMNGAISQPPSINPEIKKRLSRTKRKQYSPEDYISGIIAGNRTILSRAITLLESSQPKHYELAQQIIEGCLPYSSHSVRIGISGVPGAGKSTFIEAFGKLITGKGKKLAVLAIDPSSSITRGSILGDKTRMESLSNDPQAYIRPSPAAGTMGGVARKTRETIILCEAAGFDTILVETVGVGQSETEVASMVDFFLLLMLAGAGDVLQGIKRGIMEMADLIAINKADGDNIQAAEKSASEYRNAIRLFPQTESGWIPKVITCSAFEGTGIEEIWQSLTDYVYITRKSGFFGDRRKRQAVIRMHSTIEDYLKKSFYNNAEIKKMCSEIESQLRNNIITSYRAATDLLDKYFKRD